MCCTVIEKTDKNGQLFVGAVLPFWKKLTIIVVYIVKIKKTITPSDSKYLFNSYKKKKKVNEIAYCQTKL